MENMMYKWGNHPRYSLWIGQQEYNLIVLKYQKILNEAFESQQILKPKTMKTKQEKREIYLQLFRKWLELTQLKVGDKVKVISDFSSLEESSTGHMATDYVERMIGKEFKVVSIAERTVQVDIPYSFDFRALEKVEEVTYCYGQKFKVGNNTTMLVQCGYGEMCLICLDGYDVGNRWSTPIKILNVRKVTMKELLEMSAQNLVTPID